MFVTISVYICSQLLYINEGFELGSMRGGRTFDCKKVAQPISFAQLVIQGNTNQLVKQGNTNNNEDDDENQHCQGNTTYIICGFPSFG